MDGPLTIAQCLRLAAELTHSDSPRLDVELLLCRVLERDRSYLFAWPDKSLAPDQQARFLRDFSRRRQGEPVAHILGQREFWSLPLYVDDTTLIPRPDSECLVEAVLDLYADDVHNPPRRLLDLGTGTGALALALASEKRHWDCLGVDLAPGAVALAERNRTHLRLSNARFLRSDWFSQLPAGERFNVIVSNPPYLDEADPHLDQGDLRFEPRSALVAADRGLADLALIIARSTDYLLPGGWLLVEHGYTQAADVRGLFDGAGFNSVASRRDLGGHERITLGRWLPERIVGEVENAR